MAIESVMMLVILSCIVGVVMCAGTGGKEAGNKEPLIYGLLTERCWNILAVNKILDFGCIKMLMMKVLGYSIVVVSVIVKVPQVIKILKAGSTEGLSELVLYTETLGYMIGFFYPFHYSQPFSAYGENLFIAIQSLIILGLLWYYNRKRYPLFLVLSILAAYGIFAAVLLHGEFLNDRVWALLYAMLPQASMQG